MELNQNEEPRLVNAGQGSMCLSTVEYKSRFLYSRYNPKRAILEIIGKLELLPETLIVACSPCLWYGLEELKEKLPADCTVIALESQDKLLDLAKNNCPDNTIRIFHTKNKLEIDSFMRELVSIGKTRRSVRIDFSAGIQFDRNDYDYTSAGIQEIITNFWQNRITLVKFGKLFSRNVLKNLPELISGLQLEDVEKTVNKPIIVCGAGETLDQIPDEILKSDSFFKICVDASLSPLVQRGARIDAVCAMESQIAIDRAYIGLKGRKIPMFLDICSRKETSENLSGPKIYFASRYAPCRFLKTLEENSILTNLIDPMGSVGLAATYVALKLRKNSSVPVYVSGLDFSFTAGRTHARGTMAHKALLEKSGRTIPAENYDSTFSQNTYAVDGKNGKKVYTSRIMEIYANQFVTMFSKSENLFDMTDQGISLKLAHAVPATGGTTGKQIDFSMEGSSERKEKIRQYINTEREMLSIARDLLSNGEKSKYHDKEKDLTMQIDEILRPRDYLYLHFPDGHNFNMSESFLKRIRAEIDSFLKLLYINE